MQAAPLAYTLRPSSFDDIVGQSHLISKKSFLRFLIEKDRLSNAIFYGPPGTGKTTVAELIANHTNSQFVKLNATSASVKQVRETGEKARKSDSKILTLIDEIHRFSKTQSDALLPYTEEGSIILIGATTENPFHTIHPAIISRSNIFQFNPISKTDLLKLVKKILNHYKNQNKKITIESTAIKTAITACCGDARKLISILEMAVEYSDSDDIKITEEIINQIVPFRHALYHNNDDKRYDYAAAFQDSIQVSDVDSAIFWLAAWLESGEDPRYIGRRLLVAASEDAAGNPEAVATAHAAYTAAKEIGRPECDILLAHATILTATAPRNKEAANAIWMAVNDIKKGKSTWVPKSMRDAHYPGAKKLEHGKYSKSEYMGTDKRYYIKGST